VLSVGGFVSDVRAWTRFEKRWREALDEAGIKHFHMTDFVSGAKGFEQYKNRPDRQAKVLAKLCHIIRKNTRKSIATTVVLDDWRTVNGDYYLKECRLSPYAIAAFAVMQKAVPWIGRARKGHTFTEFVFEQGDTGQGDFKWLIDELLRTATPNDREVLEASIPSSSQKRYCRSSPVTSRCGKNGRAQLK
jgi:hypothetical protein